MTPDSIRKLLTQCRSMRSIALPASAFANEAAVSAACHYLLETSLRDVDVIVAPAPQGGVRIILRQAMWEGELTFTNAGDVVSRPQTRSDELLRLFPREARGGDGMGAATRRKSGTHRVVTARAEEGARA